MVLVLRFGGGGGGGIGSLGVFVCASGDQKVFNSTGLEVNIL